jgi:hypothetical protein
MTGFITSFEEIGREEGQRQLVLRQLTRKIGPLTPELHTRVSDLKAPALLDLADALLEFASVADLTVWLERLHARQEYERRYGMGWSDGCRDERRKITTRLVTRRVGKLSPDLQTRVAALGMGTMIDLIDAIFTIHDERGLRDWLDHVSNPGA